MKKLISFLLVIMLLSSISVSAFAVTDTQIGVSNETHKIEVADGKDGKAETELWLQVDASGQIDVTVPLVLVFRTNIDGGKADTASNYTLKNNNNANVVVTSVDTTEVTADPMTLKSFNTDISKAENQYKVRLSAYKTYESATSNTKVDYPISDGGKYEFDLSADHSNDAAKGGLFTLNRNTDDRTADTYTYMVAEMETSKLGFVTTINGDKMDEESGVKLLTVTYTVAINTKDQYGETIAHGNMTPDDATDNIDIDVAGADKITKWNSGSDNT